MAGQSLQPWLLERRNQVEYSPAGAATWQPAPADLALAPGDRLCTGAESAARVGFADGTVLALGAATALRVDQLDGASGASVL